MLVTVLSLSDNWDFNLRGFAKILPDGVDGIRSSINELTRRGYLTGGQERGARGQFGKNVIEVHQTPVLPYVENPYTVKPITKKANSDTPYTGNPRQVINNKVSNKKVKNNKVNHHQSICKVDGMKETEATLTYHHLLQEVVDCNLTMFEIKQRVTKELKILISYEIFESSGEAPMVDALLDYMSEIIALGHGVAFQDVTYDVHAMGNQFYKLDSEAIKYVLWKFKEASEATRIQNKKNYLIRMLITAKSDMRTSIAGDVNYDMAHWHERGMK